MPKDFDDKLAKLAKDSKGDNFEKIDEMEKELNLDEEKKEEDTVLEEVIKDTPAVGADQLRPK